MARLVNQLTDKSIRAAKPREAAYKLPDGDGLYLLVSEAGSKLWRLRYRHGNRESMLSLGEYPAVSLGMARERRDDARRLVAKGIDPAAAKRAERESRDDTFKVIAKE